MSVFGLEKVVSKKFKEALDRQIIEDKKEISERMREDGRTASGDSEKYTFLPHSKDEVIAKRVSDQRKSNKTTRVRFA